MATKKRRDGRDTIRDSIADYRRLALGNDHLAHYERLNRNRRNAIVLDRATCDWVIDEEADTAMCRTHGEIVDGVDSKHFPGARVDTDVRDD
jgi:hypothetical protein